MCLWVYREAEHWCWGTFWIFLYLIFWDSVSCCTQSSLVWLSCLACRVTHVCLHTALPVFMLSHLQSELTLYPRHLNKDIPSAFGFGFVRFCCKRLSFLCGVKTRPCFGSTVLFCPSRQHFLNWTPHRDEQTGVFSPSGYICTPALVSVSQGTLWKRGQKKDCNRQNTRKSVVKQSRNSLS